MTLALFGFGKNGEVVDDSQLPAILTTEWLEGEGNAEKPFPSFARLLAKRGTPEGESRYSWTVDFAARRAQARKEMQPHLDETERIKAHLVTLKERLKAFKKDKAEISDIEALEQQIKEQEKAARDFQTKADAIDAAVFDLKAVNPNVVAKVDIRTPAEIIENIAAQGRIVSSALEKLKLLMTEPD
jgi:type I restriction enzyme M protein